jgi:hydrogenase maturation protein HypF
MVQGVGFRPWVWHLARSAGLSGETFNDGQGVLIRAWGTAGQLAAFEQALRRDPPPLARVDTVERLPLSGVAPSNFRIVPSQRGAIATGIVPDAATCSACLAELFDRSNRRYRYPFTNCTHCGPRLSIVTAVPYDRATTSMAAFPMCRECQAEYDDPASRRFHAEPNACPSCGPRVWLAGAQGRPINPAPGADAIERTAALIRQGLIVAIKGIGGFHLACDATNDEAVTRLRHRKRRFHKPFALMARDTAMIEAYAAISDAEAALLSSTAAPIVVLNSRGDGLRLAADVSAGQATVGVMLPYTPLHHLLARALDKPFVLTSGNVSDEPQVTANDAALRQLADIADAWLLHDRDIINRLDDSVVRVIGGQQLMLRRARGYAPAPLALPVVPEYSPRVLAMGAELKSTFCLARSGQAVLSQHIGDLEDAATHQDYRQGLELYRRLYDFTPEVIAVDRHPDYLSTQWGRALAARTGARIVAILHHHAHVAAVLAEHGVALDAPPVLGIVFDGLGIGEQGELWGGEFLIADYRNAERVGAFNAVPLLGGNRAMREPWRNAFAHLHHSIGWDVADQRYSELPIIRLLRERRPAVLRRMMEARLNAPSASSAGRMLDAAAAMIGVRPEGISYEGQAAIELEALALPALAEDAIAYPSALIDGKPVRIGWHPLWLSLLDDIKRGVAPAITAARVHRGVIAASVAMVRHVCRMRDVSTIVLSGGVFQNSILLDGLSRSLETEGFAVLRPCQVPPNDGGIAYGQAAIAAAIANR